MVEDIIKRWKRAHPLLCHRLGIHDFDGMLPDMRPEAIETRIDEIQQDLVQLNSNDDQTMPSKLECELIIIRLKAELFRLRELKEYEESPLFWIEPLQLVETSFAVTEFASLDKRISIIIEFESHIPEYLGLAELHLKQSLPFATINRAITQLRHVISYFEHGLISFIVKTDREDLINNWSEVNTCAVTSMKHFLQKLESYYKENAVEEFALGRDRFLKLLKHTEEIDLPYKELVRIAEENLQKDYSKLLVLAEKYGGISNLIQKIRNFSLSPDKVIQEVTTALKRTKNFLIDTGIVQIPNNRQCEVIKTPNFARDKGFAALNSPGPFEESPKAGSYFWITPPEEAWNDFKKENFMLFFNLPFLEIIVIHEIWPGHYLQLLYARESKSEILKLLANSTTILEGWAHYAEEMMLQEGYGINMPKLDFERVELVAAQILASLLRNCRFLTALKLHCEDWDLESAKRLFMEKAFLPDLIADLEANRGIFDPMYLNYALGKLLIQKLRTDYEKEKGQNFDLPEFHKTVLSYGPVPITILRQLMLRQPSDRVL